MWNILTTILPIFAIILLGWALRRLGLMHEEFSRSANRLVYFVAIPAMIFREIAGAALTEHFNFTLAATASVPPILVMLAALALARGARIRPRQTGTFLQCCFHGNLGYIGLAVAYYFLGNYGFTRASILAGFLMLVQNILAVTVLSTYNTAPRAGSSPFLLLRQIILNPIVLSVTAGILFALWELALPVMVDRSLKILGGMALPLALLVIGTSLSFARMRRYLAPVVLIGLCKLLLLPALGLILFQVFGISGSDSLPALILLASPTATVSYVMAREMSGDADLATSAVSVTTLVSALSFMLWLGLSS